MDELQSIQDTIIKMNQDIDVLNIKRSGLQNEIEKAIKDNQAIIETKYAAHKLKIDAELEDIANKKSLVAKLIEETSNYVSGEKEKIKKEYSELNIANIAISEARDVFIKERERANIEYNARKDELNAQENKLNEFRGVLQQFDSELKGRKYALDNKEFQLNALEAKLNDDALGISADRDSNQSLLDKAQQEHSLILNEKNEILIFSKQLKDKEAELKSLSSVKDDLAALEIKKGEVEKETLKLSELSKALAKKQEDSREKELSLNERAKSIEIDSRKNDEKIKIIQRLREELKTNG